MPRHFFSTYVLPAAGAAVLVGCGGPPPSTQQAPAPVYRQSVFLTGPELWADSAAREIDRAVIVGDLDRLRHARELIDRALLAYPNDALLLHYEGYELYREAGLLDGLGGKGAQEVPLVAATARNRLQQSLAIKPLPETHALMAAVLGTLISADRTQASILGPMIPTQMNAALSLGPSNPRVWLLRGIQSMYTPEQYGGGLAVAETQLRKAVELFASDNAAPPSPHWGKAEAYVWLGQVLNKENKLEEARTAYYQALTLEPTYPWVTYSLLPRLGRN